MKKKTLAIVIGAVLLLGILTLALAGNPFIHKNSYDFGQSVKSVRTETVKFNDIVPFEWDMVYTFDPYMSKREIEEIVGFKSRHIYETVSEGMTQLLFVKDGKVVCSICGYGSNLGYSFSFGMHDGNYLAISNEDNAIFTVDSSNETVNLIYNK